MIKRLFFSVILTCLCLITVPLQASAANLVQGGNCSNPDNSKSALCQDTAKPTNPLYGPDGVLIKVADIVAYVAGAAAVIIIIIGSLQYITSGGDSNKASSAKSTITGALIGLVIIATAGVIINFVIGKL